MVRVNAPECAILRRMSDPSEPNLAVFCDYENVALGAQDAAFGAFDIDLVIERLLEKGKVVVKKAYSDWSRYDAAKRPLHEAAFELIEIPHVSYSGKNSADIRLVVDALDLCYTKSHVTVFVIVSGDSDFSPLVSKLRENDKRVIGVGVKNSSSKLLIENCDEFIYYDDLIRERKKRALRVRPSTAAKTPRKIKPGGGDETTKEKDKDPEGRREEALDIVLETIEALLRDRPGPLWGSHVKQTMMRKRPNFSEAFHGYRSFNELLQDAERRGLLQLKKDEPSGGYIVVGLSEP
jgi:uncharacterized protein (TIGR00288 family)